MTVPAYPSNSALAGRGAQDKSASTVALLFFVLVTCVGIAGVGGGLFPVFYVGAAVVAALVAYYRAPTRYVSFVFALWFFTPFVRRVFDYRHGFTPASLILVAPTLATLVAILTAFYRARELRGTMLYPFILTVTGVGYAYFIGVLKVGFMPATYALLTWLAPISFSMHLILSWRIFPALRESFLSFLQWAVPVVAAYGIVQVWVLPAWDKYWMLAADLGSIGAAVPFGFRIFGTLNSPGTYAIALLVGMLYLLGTSRRGMVVALSLAFVSLLLTRTRSSWVALLVGILVIQFMGPVRRMARNWLFLLFILALAVPVMSLDVFRDSIFARIASFTSLSEDNSVQTRLMLSNIAVQNISATAEGEGLGATGGGTKLGGEIGRQASIDNGLLEVFYVLGWPGGAMVALGLIGHLLTLARFRDSREDAFANAARACFWALLSTLVIGDIFSGAIGVLFWGAYGFACSAHAYNYAMGKGLRSRQVALEFAGRQPAAVGA